MSPLSPVPFESLTSLSRAVDRHLPKGSSRMRSSVFNLCVEAVAFGREEPASRGVRARSAAHLLLELACPELADDTRDELSEACERAAQTRG